MRHALLVIVLSFQIGVNLSGADGRGNVQFQKHGSHSSSNNSLNRSARCIPCEQSLGAPLERGFPVTNHVNSEYRGNGADNLGYDWSPKAWGGLAYPQKSRGSMIRMGGRDGRQMLKDWNQSQGGGVRIICDTCRAYWDGARGGSNSIRDPGRFPVQNAPSFFGSKPSYWHRGRMMNSQDYETRVSSGAVGVLIKPGSRIAYIPSRSGEMIWDGVSGGGTRWDGFSNGISWVASGGPEWDHGGREQKPDYTSGSPRSNNDYFFNSNPYRPWGGQKGISSWDNAGKGYYFSNGYPGPVDFQWRDRGYASNWQYSSTNQNGWNGSSMKWNYGSKHWDEK